MKRIITLLLVLFFAIPGVFAQFSIFVQNPEAEQIMLGSYDPSSYAASVTINHPDSILNGIINQISKDTLQAYLEKIDSYYNRNSGSDTISDTYGIGAVRRWIFKKFQDYSAANENRLIVSFLEFDRYICDMYHHKNVFGVLPGMDTTKKEILFIEGHYDTRCEGACDTTCYSPGMEDNGSGTVLVMELARIMSRYTFDYTIVFCLPTAEDQGLFGATAFAKYFLSKDINVKACFNNDVIGGIYCGYTSSPPSCPYVDHVDSTNVRIFTYAPGNDSAAVSPHRQLARYVKMNQEERINPLLNTPMEINIINREDRVGRGGDHIPFRERGYTAFRLTSQNEHGDGSGTLPDRQHTSTDVLGVDLTIPPDGIIDSFFVDMGYLSRNAITNGVNLGLLAISPPMPDPVFNALPDGVEISMVGPDSVYRHYRLAIRSDNSGTLDFDTIYTFTNTTQMTINGLEPDKEYYISVANVGSNNVASLFCDEFTILTVGIQGHLIRDWGLKFKQNRPNPFSDQTKFIIEASTNTYYQDANLSIRDVSGKIIQNIPFTIQPGINNIDFSNPGRMRGVYTCSLNINGNLVRTIKMTVSH